MAEFLPRYRFRGSIKPTAEVKRPVKAYRAETTGASDAAGKPNSATIDIFDVIDSWGGYWGVSASEVDAALTEVGKVDTLYVRINSPGGEATEGVAIANLLRAHAATIHTTNYGLAASAASVVAVAGDTLSMAPGSMLMIHEASNGIYGSADDLRAEAAVLDKFNDSYAAVYALKGGTETDWRALMHAETWFTPQDAVKIGLADKVGIESSPLPANVEPAMPESPDGDGETPFDRAARMFDLSVFAHPPAAKASNLPAEPPEKHPPIKEAVTMTPEQIKALRERLSLPDDADEATVQAKLVEHTLTEPEPPAPPEITDETVAAHYGVDAEKIRAAVDTVKGDKVTLSQVAFDELKAMASEGREARAKQREQERDEAIDAAFKAGKISAERRDAWRNAWDKDPEGTAKDLTSLEARFPVGQPTGYAGTDGTDGDGVKPFTDDEADALAQLAGVRKEALTNG